MAENNLLNKNIKSSAKAIGVKSVLNIDSKTRVVTSFGKGNDAVLEKKIVENNIEKEYGRNLSLNVQKPKYEFKSTRRIANGFKGYTDNSDDYSGNDRLRLKPVFESMIFDKEDSFDDNIRVQIAYAVFDIVKALSSHSNNITYAINHLQRNNKDDDIVGGVINYMIDYNEFKGEKRQQFDEFYDKASFSFAYCDDILTKKNGKNKKLKDNISKGEAYATFSVLSFLRNNISHFANSDNSKFDIFRNEYDGVNYLRYIRKTINDFFNTKIREVNNNFFKNEKVNFSIAVNSLGLKETKSEHNTLANILYSLSVEKTTIKMLGYSLKKLRECAIEKGYISFGNHSEQEISAVRSKIYKLIDLVVLYIMQNNFGLKRKVESIVDELRLCRSEQNKDEIYFKYSEILFNDRYVKNVVNQVIKNVLAYCKNPRKYTLINLDKEYIKGKKPSDDYHDFTKLVLYICNFLDGKEINDLLTRLINRFQVIGSFNDTVESLKDDIEPHKYNEHYSLFEQSNAIAEELFLVKSLARMNHSIENVKMAPLYKDALLALGVPYDKLNEMYGVYFTNDKTTRVSSYIANNVINSTRFQYIIKYISPDCVYEIAQNKIIVSFVLDQLPKKQLDKYYESVLAKKPADKATEVREICSCITETSFENNFAGFKNLDRRNKLSQKERINREKGKALLRLYFTVVYLVVKNLVNINSLYSIAFFYLERDCRLFSEKMGENKPDAKNKPLKKYNTHYDILTRIFMYDKSLKLKDKDVKKLSRYVVFNEGADVDKETSEYPYGINSKRNPLYRTYRNNVMHINAVSQMEKYLGDVNKLNSYFELYHYIIQRRVIDSLNDTIVSKKNSEKTKDLENIESCYEYANDLLKNNTSPKLYSQTLLRSMNLPFGYTLPRYKNLSYEKFFDKQRLEEKQKQIEREKGSH